jgi:hypothetical protein
MIDFDDYPDYVEFTEDDERALADMDRQIQAEARRAQLRQQREQLEGGRA